MCFIRLNRPDSLNAFRPEMLEELARLLGLIENDLSIVVVILEGKGKAFSAGVDLKVLQGINPKGGKVGDLFDEPARVAYTAIRDCRCPVIAKVHGACFTGALEMALHCDFVLTTVDTKFGDTHAKFGLRPTWGMTQTLSQAVGIRRAKELSYTARTFLGGEAVELGIANQAMETREDLDRVTLDCAESIARNSRSALGAIKDLYRLSEEALSMPDALRAELSREYPEIDDTSERLGVF
ncbi:MAG: enoyl-CoA hydratase/isomerase family protein [Candidatus Azotimanducaceae bacterium]